MILTISCSVFAFIVGSIPFGIVFSRLFGKKDPREVGSGNIGATNVLRSSGNKSIAVLTLIADIVKGSIVVLLANQIQNQYNFFLTLELLCGLAAILGHIFSPFVKFKGGKGVATALGVFFVLAPYLSLLSLGIFVLIAVTTRIVSISSLIAVIAFPISSVIFNYSLNLTFLSIIIAFLIFFRHKENIMRLINRVENKF
tara:strand:+ start:11961 stop:12557 length:597 start_codon:yes stop_codon:yes gene_type:complete